jgi:eukaryotic-like serine/threonine-protein kinase
MPIVPNVVSLPQSAAEASLSAADLALGTVTRAHSTEVAAGSVIGTNPAAGTPVEPGTAVNLSVSDGPAPKVEVPDMAGLTRQGAEGRKFFAAVRPSK